MEKKQNLHTHTTFCDGRDTPEELIQIAIDKNFDSIGFSMHSYNPHSAYSHVTLARMEEYKSAIRSLKERYRGRFSVYLGLQKDMVSPVENEGYDYLIGSVHYLNKEGTFLGFDRSPEFVKELIDTHFGGNGLAFARCYYETAARLAESGPFDIIGHFDILTKNLDFIPYFDETQEAYLNYAREAIGALRGKIPFFEVNTGAVARGYRKVPYPAEPLIREFHRLGFGAVITSDCHDARYLDCGFQEAEELLAHCGFREKYRLTESGFEAVALSRGER